MNNFAKNLNFLIEYNQYSRSEICTLLNINPSRLCYYERGRCECGFERLVAFSKIFSVTVDALLKEDLKATYNVLLSKKLNAIASQKKKSAKHISVFVSMPESTVKNWLWHQDSELPEPKQFNLLAKSLKIEPKMLLPSYLF